MTVSEVTKYTPFYVFYGWHPIMPLDAMCGVSPEEPVLLNKYMKKIHEDRQKVIEFVYEQKMKASQRYSDRYNQMNKHKISADLIKPGDFVRIQNEKRVGEYGKKYNFLASRDYYVVDRVLEGGATCILRDLKGDELPDPQNILILNKIYLKHEINVNPNEKEIVIAENVVNEVDNNDNGDDVDDFPLDEDDDENLNPWYAINEILDKHQKAGMTEYKVWWQGYRKNQATWVPEESCSEEAIKAFDEKQE